MKKLQKLTLKELGESALVLDQSETIGLKGGDGGLPYMIRYGSDLPDGTSYDPFGDVCYPTPDSSSTLSTPTSGSVGYVTTDEWVTMLAAAGAGARIGRWGGFEGMCVGYVAGFCLVLWQALEN